MIYLMQLHLFSAMQIFFSCMKQKIIAFNKNSCVRQVFDIHLSSIGPVMT